jgi:tetratricopeptide (TPR) repeat protein
VTAGSVATGLLGRDAELAEVRRALEAARDGAGGLLLVSGEPGIGKTALAEAAGAAARALGMTPAWGRAWEAGGAPVLWPWSQAVRDLAGQQPDAADGAGPAVWEDLGDEAAAVERLSAALAVAAERTPLLVVLEDLHAAAEEAVEVLADLVPALSSLPILVLATFRSRTSRSAEGVRECLAELSAAHPHLRLGGLEDADVAALLEALGQPEAPASRLRRATGGNPHLVTLLARTAYTPAEDSGHTPQPPEELRAHVRLQLDGLPGETVGLLEVTALLLRSTSIEVIAAVAERNPERTRRALAPALDEGILELDGSDLRFRHDVVREALYADLAPARRTVLHRRAAAALSALGGDDVRLRAEAVHHAYHAALGDGGPQLEPLVSAAREAREAGALAEAAALLAHAADCAEAEGAPAAERARLLTDLAGVQEELGRFEGAERSWHAALALGRLSGHAEVLAAGALGVARSGLLAGWSTPAHSGPLEDALAAVGGEPSPLRSGLLAHLAAALHWTAERGRSRALAEEALAVARRCDDPEAIATASIALHYITRGAEHARERIALASEAITAADRAASAFLGMVARSGVVVDQRQVGDPEGVAAAIEDLRRHAGAHAHEPSRWAADVHALVSALLRDDRETADDLHRRLDKVAEGARDRRYLVEFASCMTDLAPLPADVIERLRRRTRRIPEVVAWRARVLLATIEQGGDDDLDAELGAIIALLRAPARTDPHWLLAAALTAEAVALLGDGRRARILSELLAPHHAAFAVGSRVGATRGPVRYHLGILALTSGDPAAIDHLEAAADLAALADHRAHLPRIAEALRRARELAARGTGTELGTLARTGDFWMLERADRTVPVADVKGLRHLAHLLATPNQPIRALDLHRLDGGGGAAAAPPGTAGELGVDAGGGDAVLDDVAKRAFRARLTRLAEQLGHLGEDDPRSAALLAEQAALEATLAAGVGRGGRDRRLSSEAERARTTVTKALRAAVERLRSVDPEVGAHLDEALVTGAVCSYVPRSGRLRVRP